jgi:hypothetical protein
VLLWSRATRDLLKSFGWGIAALHRLNAATKLPCSRRQPHSIFSYRDTRAPNAEVSRASRVARAPERAMLAAGCTTVIGGPLHRGFVQSASAIVAIDPGRCRVSTLQQRSDIPEEQIWLDKEKSATS